MLIDAVFDNGQIKFLQPLQFAHQYFRVQIDIPTEEIVAQENEPAQTLSDEYIQEHWRELIMTSSTDPQQDDDEVLQEEYGAYLSAKHST